VGAKRLTDLSRDTALGGAESKDLGGAYLPMLLGAFQEPKPDTTREKYLKGWRRAEKLNLVRTIHPEFKDPAETWDGDDYSA
jgi:hypothetical protein